ncbi:unnamed protein product [Miscanthus lutarioriparius]|uniref:Uncharacterized protein n=1 Tax=Miscanthus lutarioriparius TaxID=422564 RepID=A0A811QCE1_9POAL|nr:unnamed protein product [Miscanthus lutarioriparius]
MERRRLLLHHAHLKGNRGRLEDSGMSMSLTVVQYLGLYGKEKERPDLVSVSPPPSLSKEEHANDDIGQQMHGDDRL